MSTGWLAAAGAAAYGVYQHHMRKHHQGHGHGHGHGGDGCSCGAMRGEFEHEHHTKFKHSSTAAHHDGKCCSENDGPHVTVLAETKRATEVVQA